MSGVFSTTLPSLPTESFKIVAALDHDPAQVGKMIGDLTIQPMSELTQTIAERNIRIGIVAVPSTHAQEVIDLLVENDVRGILNYAPIAPQVPLHIVVRNLDPVLSLQSMTFYLRDND